jgi:hypothetical protein
MAIVFQKKEKIQKNLILVFIVVVLITAFVIWLGFFKKEKELPLVELPVLPKKEIKINFDILKSPALEKLQPFSEIEPFKETLSPEGKIEEKLGRENPFIPY